ncbi:MAG: 50S ribosomal protein L24 [Euryarchaeota archaeon]|nr:50S ribosomal protein L24 [Euryarchaeota archaeon]MDE1880847.1 50S ribosomal protein L24 [Euryarchaeota archaeon]MDE2043919.1 50S ribosomal protein L24 [Thermoplasmata archaeon]
MQPSVKGTTSYHPRAQRKALYRAPHHLRRKRLALPLSRELRSRYGRRRIPVRKGDTVRVLAGNYIGREERVAKVDYRHYAVVLDNVTLQKADKKLKQLPLPIGHLMITKLNLADPWRRRVLKAPEEAAEEEAEEVSSDEAAEESGSKSEPETEKKEPAGPKGDEAQDDGEE